MSRQEAMPADYGLEVLSGFIERDSRPSYGPYKTPHPLITGHHSASIMGADTAKQRMQKYRAKIRNDQQKHFVHVLSL